MKTSSIILLVIFLALIAIIFYLIGANVNKDGRTVDQAIKAGIPQDVANAIATGRVLGSTRNSVLIKNQDSQIIDGSVCVSTSEIRFDSQGNKYDYIYWSCANGKKYDNKLNEITTK